jgi:hypothetical protein
MQPFFMDFLRCLRYSGVVIAEQAPAADRLQWAKIALLYRSVLYSCLYCVVGAAADAFRWTAARSAALLPLFRLRMLSCERSADGAEEIR